MHNSIPHVFHLFFNRTDKNRDSLWVLQWWGSWWVMTSALLNTPIFCLLSSTFRQTFRKRGSSQPPSSTHESLHLAFSDPPTRWSFHLYTLFTWRGISSNGRVRGKGANLLAPARKKKDVENTGNNRIFPHVTINLGNISGHCGRFWVVF